MNTKTFDNASLVMEKNGVLAKKMFDTDKATGILMRFEAGGFVAEHSTPADAVFFAVTGEITAAVGGEKALLKAPASAESPKDIPHGLLNESGKTAEVLVIKLK